MLVHPREGMVVVMVHMRTCWLADTAVAAARLGQGPRMVMGARSELSPYLTNLLLVTRQASLEPHAGGCGASPQPPAPAALGSAEHRGWRGKAPRRGPSHPRWGGRSWIAAAAGSCAWCCPGAARRPAGTAAWSTHR